jgi:hypothetical protein
MEITSNTFYKSTATFRTRYIMTPSSLVVTDVSEEPDAISPLWTFQAHTKYSSPFHVLTLLSAYRQTLAWRSFSRTEADQMHYVSRY